jgi:phosphomannomutase
VIDPRIVPGRDSLVGMAYVLQLMAETGEERRPIGCRNPAVRDREDEVRVPAGGREPGGGGGERMAFASERVDVQDGIRIDWDRAWVHARPSNTSRSCGSSRRAPDRATAEEKIATGAASGRRGAGRGRGTELLTPAW